MNTFSSAFKKRKDSYQRRECCSNFQRVTKRRTCLCPCWHSANPTKLLPRALPRGKQCVSSLNTWLFFPGPKERDLIPFHIPGLGKKSWPLSLGCLGRQCRAQEAAGPTGSPAFVSQPNLPPHNLTLLKLAMGSQLR